MKTRTIILSVALIFAVPALSNAQVGNLLKKKMGKVINAGTNTLEKEVGKEIDTAAQKEAQKISTQANENMNQNKGQEGQPQSDQAGNQQPKGINLGGLMGGKVTSKYNESYAFKSRIYMQMEIYNKDKKDVTKMDYYMYFSDTDPSAGFESKMIATSDEGKQVTVASSFVFDGVNKSFLMMTDMGAMKMAFISQVPDETTVQDQSAEKTSKPVITKTGNTKIIAGYKCDEYLYKETDSKEYGKLWVTKDLKFKTDKRTFSKAGLSPYYGNPELEDGFVLAMEGYNEKNELEMKSETKEINFDFPHTISTAGFKFSQMNFNQAGGQQKK
jgi:hypothetical protein